MWLGTLLSSKCGVSASLVLVESLVRLMYRTSSKRLPVTLTRERCLRLCHQCSHVSPDKAELCEKKLDGVLHCLAGFCIQTCWVRKVLG